MITGDSRLPFPGPRTGPAEIDYHSCLACLPDVSFTQQHSCLRSQRRVCGSTGHLVLVVRWRQSRHTYFIPVSRALLSFNLLLRGSSTPPTSSALSSFPIVLDSSRRDCSILPRKDGGCPRYALQYCWELRRAKVEYGGRRPTNQHLPAVDF